MYANYNGSCQIKNAQYAGNVVYLLAIEVMNCCMKEGMVPRAGVEAVEM